MVYRSSRRVPQSEDEDHRLQSFESDDSIKDVKFSKQAGSWKIFCIILIFICLALSIGLIITATQSKDGKTGSVPVCGANKKKFQRSLDHSEPEHPGPFHDLTKKEIKSVIDFLQKDPATKIKSLEVATPTDAVLYMMDLLQAKKVDVDAYLAGNAAQPERQARAVVFRPDLNPPVVQELDCGPLPEVTKCTLIKSKSRRNPIEYSLRPLVHPMEWENIFEILFPKIDKQIGYILRESYGMSFANCGPEGCLKFYPAPIGSNIVGNIKSREMWFTAMYPVEYYGEYVIDFAMLTNMGNVNPEDNFISKIWYHGLFFESVDDFIRQYNASSIQKTRMRMPKVEPKDSFSSLYQRGDPIPAIPQRPPTLVEPDGKRYSVKHREVDYLGWKFNFRMSPLSGPSLSNIRYRGERIAYELSLAEISVMYSSDNPQQRLTDYADSGAMLGMQCRTLIPGADCPDSATFIPQTFAGMNSFEPLVVKHGFCLFENNFGHPLRRHSSYSQYEGGYYGGMLDSALVLRSIVTVVNYDYVIDFIFHQSGAIQTQVMSTGYILPLFYRDAEKPYGFKTHENFLAPIHHHMFNFKADLDISGVSNRYETLDIKPDAVKLRHPKNHVYHQTRFERSLKKTEKEALFKFDFEKPKYHIVHNDAHKTKFGEPKSFRIHMEGMSKQLLKDNENNEQTLSWGRHQLVVTKHKDDEFTSSSPYAMFDSLNPVVNFTRFYDDNDNIVDEDLVFWITSGVHHIPHSEDLPITPTVGHVLKFFILPYNYYPSCPSVNSRDHVRIQLKDMKNPQQGVKIDRHGYEDEQCMMPQYATKFDELLREQPDIAVEIEA